MNREEALNRSTPRSISGSRWAVGHRLGAPRYLAVQWPDGTLQINDTDAGRTVPVHQEPGGIDWQPVDLTGDCVS